MEVNYKDEFIKFLSENDCSKDFAIHLDHNTYDYYLTTKKYDMLIYKCIVWGNTDKGKPFWHEMNNKWLERLKQLKGESNNTNN